MTSAEPALTGELAAVWAQNMRKFPRGTQLQYFNDSQMAESVLEISRELSRLGVVNGSYEAFTSLRPMAFRSDLWRYMKLWQHGGFYFDHKLVVMADIGDWFDLRSPGILWLVKDAHPGAYYQAIMASPPRHPVLEVILRYVVRNVQERRYPKAPPTPYVDDSLALTGPVAVGEAMGIHGVHAENRSWSFAGLSHVPAGREPKENGKLAYHFGPECDDGCVRSLEPQPRQLCRVLPSLHKPTGGLYRILYKRHQVYCDEEGPPCPKVQVSSR